MADFSFGYRPVSGAYPAQTPAQHIVGAGDTLASIAQAAYGDNRQWYLIADANGLSGSGDLTPGQSLRIPNRVAAMHNSKDSVAPYDASRITGDTTPHLPMPHQGKGCGGMGTVLTAVVAIAVAALTQQYYLASYGTAVTATGTAATTAVTAGTAAWTTGSAIAAGAIGGAAGSVAGQLTGMATGMQKGFDWKGVAQGAIGGGVSGGMAGWAPTGNAVADAVVRAAVSSLATQGIGVVTGLQSSFSWRGVAASAVGAGVGAGIAEALGLTQEGRQVRGMDPTERLAKGALQGLVAGGVAAAMRGGRVSAMRVATDVFGQALSSSLVEQIGRGSQQTEELRAAWVSQSSGSSGGGAGGGAGGPSEIDIGVDPSMAPVDFLRSEKAGYQQGDFNRLDITKSGDTLATLFKANYGYAPSHAELVQYGNYNYLSNSHDVSVNREIVSPSLETLQNTPFTSEQLQSFTGRGADYAEQRRLAALPPASGMGPTIANARAMGIYSGDANGAVPMPEQHSLVAGSGSPLSPAQRFLLRSDPLYQSSFTGGVYGLARLGGIDDGNAMVLGGMAGMVADVAGARMGSRSGIRQTPYGTFLAEEALALGRIAENNRAGSPWADLRQGYVRARSQVDFAHIEADVSLKASGGVKHAKGGHFATSPMVDIVSGTETVSPNGVFKAQVNLLGPDGQFYLKTNSNGFSTLTPMNWSLAQAKGEMSVAFGAKTQLPTGEWFGASSGVAFRFFPPTSNVPLWRGYPVQP